PAHHRTHGVEPISAHPADPPARHGAADRQPAAGDPAALLRWLPTRPGRAGHGTQQPGHSGPGTASPAQPAPKPGRRRFDAWRWTPAANHLGTSRPSTHPVTTSRRAPVTNVDLPARLAARPFDARRKL